MQYYKISITNLSCNIYIADIISRIIIILVYYYFIILYYNIIVICYSTNNKTRTQVVRHRLAQCSRFTPRRSFGQWFLILVES